MAFGLAATLPGATASCVGVRGIPRSLGKNGEVMHRFVCAAVMTLVTFGVAMADEFVGIIAKVEDSKITFYKFDVQAQAKGDETTLPAAKDIKVVEGKLNQAEFKIEAGDKIENG